MSATHAINPCDIQLGCRSPLPGERAFLENLLGLILTPAGAAGVSYNAALRLYVLGYENLYWYRGGIAAWKAAKLPTRMANR